MNDQISNVIHYLEMFREVIKIKPKQFEGALLNYVREHTDDFINPLLRVTYEKVGDETIEYILFADLWVKEGEPEKSQFGYIQFTKPKNLAEIAGICYYPTHPWAIEFFNKFRLHLEELGILTPNKSKKRGKYDGTIERVREAHRLIKHMGIPVTKACKKAKTDSRTYYDHCEEATGEEPIRPRKG